ncbi:hypothetical protein CR513_39362, partial [Mucuna pruriens]
MENREAFAWSPEDMPDIDPDFLCHWLSIAPGMPPVCQKKRRLGEEKRKTTEEETTKLLQAKFVREVKYPSWLSNVVMVKKLSDKWRMGDIPKANKTDLQESYQPLVGGIRGRLGGKTHMEDGHSESLTSIFSILRKHQLKLNLDKCSFEIKA